MTDENSGLNQELGSEKALTAEQARTIESKNRTISLAKRLNAGSISAVGVRERKVFGKKEVETGSHAEALIAFRNRFQLPLTDEQAESLSFFKPAPDSLEMSRQL